MPCDARCDKCAGGDGTNATTGATECTKIAAGFTKLSTAIVACDDSGIATHTSCKTCNDGVSPADNKCLTTDAGSGYAVLASDGLTYECGAAAKCTECTL